MKKKKNLAKFRVNSLNGCATFGLGVMDTFHFKIFHDLLPHLTKAEDCAQIYYTARIWSQLDQKF